MKPENKAFYKDLPDEGKSDDDSESESEEYDYAEIQPFCFDDSWLAPQKQCVLLLPNVFSSCSRIEGRLFFVISTLRAQQ